MIMFLISLNRRKILNIYFRDGKLHTVKDGLFEILPGNVSLQVCKELEKSIGINYTLCNWVH